MKGKKSLVIIALLLLVGITSGYVVSTYAKYTSKITNKNGTATVAKWNFVNDNETQTIEINVEPTADVTTLINDRIAPGTAGSFNVALANTSEVGVDFVIELKSIVNKPTNLKFYKTRTGAGTTADPYVYSNEITPGTTEVTGQLIAYNGTPVSLNVPIYWQWAYETDTIATNDPLDTTDGENGNTITVSLDITGTQVEPGTTAITTHVD